MSTKVLGAAVFAICGLIMLVGIVSPKPAFSENAFGYDAQPTLEASAVSSVR